MRVVSWFNTEPPDPADRSRWVNERHLVDGNRHEFRWLCHRRIDPQTEVERRAREFVEKERP